MRRRGSAPAPACPRAGGGPAAAGGSTPNKQHRQERGTAVTGGRVSRPPGGAGQGALGWPREGRLPQLPQPGDVPLVSPLVPQDGVRFTSLPPPCAYRHLPSRRPYLAVVFSVDAARSRQPCGGAVGAPSRWQPAATSPHCARVGASASAEPAPRPSTCCVRTCAWWPALQHTPTRAVLLGPRLRLAGALLPCPRLPGRVPGWARTA